MRTYTIREAEKVTTKSAEALRSMVDRGQLRAVGGGRGHARRIPESELARAGIMLDQEAASPVAELVDRLAQTEKQLAAHRQLTERVEHEREELRGERDKLAVQLADAERQAAELAEWRHQITTAGWWQRRQLLRKGSTA